MRFALWYSVSKFHHQQRLLAGVGGHFRYGNSHIDLRQEIFSGDALNLVADIVRYGMTQHGKFHSTLPVCLVITKNAQPKKSAVFGIRKNRTA